MIIKSFLRRRKDISRLRAQQMSSLTWLDLISCLQEYQELSYTRYRYDLILKNNLKFLVTPEFDEKFFIIYLFIIIK